MGRLPSGGQRRGDRAPRDPARARRALPRGAELRVLVAAPLRRADRPPGGRYRRIYSDDYLDPLRSRSGAAAGDPPPRPAVARERVHGHRHLRRRRAARRRRGSSRSSTARERFDVQQRWQPQSTRGRAVPWTATRIGSSTSTPRRSCRAGFVDDFLGIARQPSPLRRGARPAGTHVRAARRGRRSPSGCAACSGAKSRARLRCPCWRCGPGAEREGPTALVDAVPIALGRADPIGRGSRSATATCATCSCARRRLAAPRPSSAAMARRAADQRAARDLRAARPARRVPRGLLRADAAGVASSRWSSWTTAPRGRRRSACWRDFAARLPLTWTRIEHSGRSAAKNLALLLARGELVLFFDDDDRARRRTCSTSTSARTSSTRTRRRRSSGTPDWDPGLEVSPLMHYLTEVDRLLFAYGNFEPGERIDWRGFWEGRVSSKRVAPPAPRAARSAPRVLDRRRACVAAARSGPRGRLPPRRAERDVAADRLRRVLPPLRGQGARPGGDRHASTTTRRSASTRRSRARRARWEAARPELPRLKARIPELEQALDGARTAPRPTAPRRWPSCTGAIARCSSPTTRRGSPRCWASTGPRAVEHASPATARRRGARDRRANGRRRRRGASGADDRRCPSGAARRSLPTWRRARRARVGGRTDADRGDRDRQRVAVRAELPARVHRFPINRGVAPALEHRHPALRARR